MNYALKGKYPIETKDQLVKTAAYLDRYLPRFHPRERSAFATAIEKRASDLRINLDYDWIKNYSRPMLNRSSVSPDFEKNMDMRKHACVNKDIKINDKNVNTNELIDKIKTAASNQSAYTTVDSIFEFDKLAGLEYQWDKSILDPIMTVFGSLNHSNFDSDKIIGDYTENDLKKIASDLSGEFKKVGEYLDVKTKKEFINDPAGVVKGMSSIEKEVFLKVLER